MRNKYFAQFTGSKVTHLPIGERLLACGRDGRGAVWEGGFHETLPEITCKSCLKYTPKGATWNAHTAQYTNAPGKPWGTGIGYKPSSLSDIVGDQRDNTTWLPSKDGDPAGILLLWGYDRFWVYTNEETS
jgi:hypothetical protein